MKPMKSVSHIYPNKQTLGSWNKHTSSRNSLGKVPSLVASSSVKDGTVKWVKQETSTGNCE